MTASTQKLQIYSEYINPMIDQYSIKQENPLILMAQACNNIGKEFTLTPKQSSPPPLNLSKHQKSHSPQESKKSLKRIASSTFSKPSTKKISTSQSSYSSSPSIFDSLFFQQFNKTFLSSSLPTFQQSSYLIDSILSSPFVCNWMDSTMEDGFCGKRFGNHIHLLEHLCTEHTTSLKSSLSSHYSSIDKRQKE